MGFQELPPSTIIHPTRRCLIVGQVSLQVGPTNLGFMIDISTVEPRHGGHNWPHPGTHSQWQAEKWLKSYKTIMNHFDPLCTNSQYLNPKPYTLVIYHNYGKSPFFIAKKAQCDRLAIFIHFPYSSLKLRGSFLGPTSLTPRNKAIGPHGLPLCHCGRCVPLDDGRVDGTRCRRRGHRGPREQGARAWRMEDGPWVGPIRHFDMFFWTTKWYLIWQPGRTC